MRSTSSILPALALAMGAMADTEWHFGDTVYMGPATDSYIKKLTYSLVPPAVPTDSAQSDAWLSIWIGISATAGGEGDAALLQPLLNWAPNNADQSCPAANDAWCVAASTYVPSTGQDQRPYVAVPNGANMDFEITTSSSGTVEQKVWIEGELVSQLTNEITGDKPVYLSASNECYSGECGSIEGYTWSNMTITLSAADENFGDTFNPTRVTTSGFKTSDNGVTWAGDLIFAAEKILV